MNDKKIPKEITDILNAVPCEEEESDLPFKMPRNIDAFLTDLIHDPNRKRLKDNKRL